jgi:hypothetical protein
MWLVAWDTIAVWFEADLRPGFKEKDTTPLGPSLEARAIEKRMLAVFD